MSEDLEDDVTPMRRCEEKRKVWARGQAVAEREAEKFGGRVATAERRGPRESSKELQGYYGGGL